MMEGFKVKCKRCGKMARPEEYVLDPIYRMMVCPSCIKERRTHENVHKEVEARKQARSVAEEEPKPTGFDKEDAYLEKAYREKVKNTVSVEKVSDDKVKYKCPKCNYKFVYDVLKKVPGRCPYCSADIFRFNA